MNLTHTIITTALALVVGSLGTGYYGDYFVQEVNDDSVPRMCHNFD